MDIINGTKLPTLAELKPGRELAIIKLIADHENQNQWEVTVRKPAKFASAFALIEPLPFADANGKPQARVTPALAFDCASDGEDVVIHVLILPHGSRWSPSPGWEMELLGIFGVPGVQLPFAVYKMIAPPVALGTVETRAAL